MQTHANTLSTLAVQGTPFEVGRQLGQFGAAAVHGYLLQSSAWATVQAWKGSSQAQAMAQLTRERFPLIWTELEGLASGLGLPLDDVFLWNARGDFWAMAPDGCTTLLLPGKAVRQIAHNEDGDPGFTGQCAIAECRIDGGASFASFIYPGSLPGHTLAVTDAGLAMTVNNIRGLHVAVGVPRMVLTRALLDTGSVAQAVKVLEASPRSGAFHLSLADCHSGQIASVEFSAYGCSVIPVVNPMLHANHAIHPDMRDYPQIITGSSGHRQIRGNQLLDQHQVQARELDCLQILGDTADPVFPIYRQQADDSDHENTHATADIRITSDGIAWQVYEHPQQPARITLHNGRLVSVGD
ncbi:MAG: peptidase C45 [Burkholderiaceae bacterium]|nr:peptidase C45 [Burkholderiaceae bacterium]